MEGQGDIRVNGSNILATLTLSDVTATDSGTYVCVAKLVADVMHRVKVVDVTVGMCDDTAAKRVIIFHQFRPGKL